MDYLSYYFNAMAYCRAVEKLLEEEVPHARPVPARDPPRAEPDRLATCSGSAPRALDLGAITMFWWGFRERDTMLDLFEMSSGQRMHTRYFQVGGVIEDIPPGCEKKCREFLARMPGAHRPVRGAARPERDLCCSA